MKHELFSWYSPALNAEMPLAIYGHYGFSILLIPTAAADFLEYQRFQMMDSLAPFLESGKCKIYSINSINKESWLNNDMEPAHKAIRHNQFNDYVINEVIPFIKQTSSEETPIYTCGASFGALHAMNLFMKYPDKINGAISMSGVYNLAEYTKGFWDDQVYFNSPEHYVQNINDPVYLDQICSSKHIHIYTGSGDYEDPNANIRFSNVLASKGIPHDLDVWGPDITHDWPTWRKMLPYILDTKF
ncbi:MAG TPA: alpha/beta hydrolase-fold protein [Flavobacteriales bacterium]|nr:alpha/beta hydrolase-fold protein [Flavobacteriales bacterium]HPH83364.1 alpha/beta hydrolase-fold protein [Flavobacteriales bacterium]